MQCWWAYLHTSKGAESESESESPGAVGNETGVGVGVGVRVGKVISTPTHDRLLQFDPVGAAKNSFSVKFSEIVIAVF